MTTWHHNKENFAKFRLKYKIECEEVTIALTKSWPLRNNETAAVARKDLKNNEAKTSLEGTAPSICDVEAKGCETF